MASIARNISQFTRKETDLAFQHAHRALQSSKFTILRAPKQHEFGRILILTSRKIGNAPQRNKMRRQLKAIFYTEKLYELKYDYIVIVKKPAITLSFQEIKDVLLTASKRKDA